MAQSQITTAHFLLGLLDEEDSTTCALLVQLLAEKGVLQAEARERILLYNASMTIDIPSPIECVRCRTEMDYVGTRKFHEGKNWGIFGEVGEFFVKKESFDVYVCPRCGSVEFFVNGVGEQLRPH